MLNLVSWLNSLREAVKAGSPDNPPRISRLHKRVIYPSQEPIHGAGFLRFQGLQRYPRPGHGNEALSVVSWHLPYSGDPDHLANSLLARSVGAVLSLALDRSIEVPAELPWTVQDSGITSFLPLDVGYDRVLHGPLPEINIINETFEELASKIGGLQEEDVVTIGSAIEMHYGACLIYKHDISSAYVLVVGALETLSARYADPAIDWNAWDKAPDWDEFAKQQDLTQEQRKALREKLLADRQIKLGERFANYVEGAFANRTWLQDWEEWTWSIDGSTGDFSGGGWAQNPNIRTSVPEEPRELRKAIKKSYAARSGFVHSGKQDINLPAEAARQVQSYEGKEPLPFTVLRAALARLIRQELDTRAGTFEFPDIVGLFDDDTGGDGA